MNDNPIRIFEIQFADPEMERVNELMRQFDVGWGPDDGACLTATYESHTSKPLDLYASELKEHMTKSGYKLYGIKEIVSPKP